MSFSELVKSNHELNEKNLWQEKRKGEKNDFARIQIYNRSMAECTLQPFNHRNLTAHFSLKCLINLLHSIILLNWVGKEASSTVANQNGYKRDREARECKAHKNRSRWEKLTGVTTSRKKWKKLHRKDGYWGAGEIDKWKVAGYLLVHIMFKTTLFKPFRGEFTL